MFSKNGKTISGKHMICDIKNIKNKKILNDINEIKKLLDIICVKENYTILGKLEHKFEPEG